MSMTLVDPAHAPVWLRPLLENPDRVEAALNSRRSVRMARRWAVPRDPRLASVLVLFAGDPTADSLPADADLLLTVRASTLRDHSGQIAFPGGGFEDGDDYPVGTALREAVEETGLDSAGVRPLMTVDALPTRPGAFTVEPVIAYWERPTPVQVMDEGETALVTRIPMKRLIAPENRFQVRMKMGGATVFTGPAFFVDRLLVWGFTGGVLDAVIAAAGWEQPWDRDDVRDLKEALALAVNE
ncbi:NUDIX hydrolase [Jongsikchunia kroppenstedtii]|uniref:NUDIX hydrolase n=1 Tax=Jongsikchunia kroppenstedtii TaxID=1121721 RepID=UPI0003708AF8|nr:CoA pyrophosphatase [Jongsikchunia kroppenstedtii]